MKIITKKGARNLADTMAYSLQHTLIAHGIKPKLVVIAQFRNELLKALGGSK